jgi:N-acetylglucosamine kinase-like BadF-type ATPase
MRGIMRRIGYKTRTLVVNDALVALVAAVGEEPGVVIVCGTGSICYGRNERGLAARAGGWGYILGDEGSGYWIGRRALAAAVREVDGRGPRTALTDDVLAHFGVPDAAGLVRIVYNREVPRANVATLGPTVQRARDRGDAVAMQILERAAEELSLAAASVASRLEMRGDAFPFILAGGMFRIVPSLVEQLRPRLLEVAPRADVRPLTVEPASGAVALALAEAHGRAAVPTYV